MPITFVALDYDVWSKNIDLASNLASNVYSGNYGFKINLDSLTGFSPNSLTSHRVVNQISKIDKPVFVDMKMWNGGRTMENMATGASHSGADIVNMYPHAGEKFFKRVKKSLEQTGTKLFGLTVLTHYTDEDTQRLYGRSLRDSVRMFAEMNQEYGADGIILPGTMLDVVEDIDLLKLCPGIRPDWYEDRKANDQEQIVTPAQAIKGGADYIVIGSPIRKSANPVEALERVLAEVEKAS